MHRLRLALVNIVKFQWFSIITFACQNHAVELEKLEKRLCNLERKNSESESRIIIPDWATVIEITGKIR